MKPRCTHAVAALAVCGLAHAASADVFLVDVTFAPPSGIELELCQDLPVVGGCDSDSSDIAGTATLRVDTTAGTAELVDFFVSTTESLDYQYLGILSEVNATASTVDVFYAGLAPTPAVPLGGDGSFTFAALPVDLQGTASVTGTVLAIGTVDETIDFAGFGPFVADFSGMLTEAAGVWTLTSSISFNESTTGEVLGITVVTTAVGALTLDGSGTGTPAACPADCDGSGTLNLDDIDCFVAGFIGADLATADCDGSGTLNLDDIDCFVASFLAGCP